MIHVALLRKYFVESRGLLIWCGIGLVLFGWMFVYMICQFDTRFLEAVFRRLPAVFEGLLPVPIEQLSSFAARLTLVYDHPLVLLLMALWCISRSSDVVAGELDRGTLELLLAQPVRREQLLWSSTANTLSGVALLALLSWLGIVIGIRTTSVDPLGSPWQLLPIAEQASTADSAARAQPPTSAERETRVPLSELVTGRQLAPAVSNYLSLGVFFCGLGTLLSSLNRYRSRTIGILAGFIVLQLMIDVLATTAEPLAWAGWLTFFCAYDPAGFVIQGLQDPQHAWSWWGTAEKGSGMGVLTGNLLLLVAGLVSLCGAQLCFRWRDIPPPL